MHRGVAAAELEHLARLGREEAREEKADLEGGLEPPDSQPFMWEIPGPLFPRNQPLPPAAPPACARTNRALREAAGAHRGLQGSSPQPRKE